MIHREAGQHDAGDPADRRADSVNDAPQSVAPERAALEGGGGACRANQREQNHQRVKSGKGAVQGRVIRRRGRSLSIFSRRRATQENGAMLDFYALDPMTRAILLYVEAVGDARKFMPSIA